tara:strand:+ start:3240 stop:4904 length:1665 start_codon:yes stop_codon:yes gene_type:complete
MINLNKCLGCGTDVDIGFWELEQYWCNICQILIPQITGCSLEAIPNKNKADKLKRVLGNPSSIINKVWKSFDNVDRKEKSWFILENQQDCKRKLFDWNENENNVTTIFSENDKELFTSGDQSKGNLETLRRLQRGGILPDGSHISWISGKFFLDGEVINLPYIDLREILEKSTDYNKYNWKLMLYLISLATENTSVFDKKNGFPGFLRRRPRLNTKYICKHPINNLETMKNQRLYESIKEITPFEMHQDMKYWINSWNRVLSDKSLMFVKKHEIPISLIIDKGRLMLRVRRNDKWRKIRVPRNLDIWSILINWCLMLPGDEKRNHLESLQYYLFCDLETETIAKAEINGIEFLRGIIDNSNGKASVEGKKIVVEGKYGVKYSISPGSGPHGSRFKVFTDIVSDKDMMQEEIFRRLNRRWQRGREMANMKQKELCIVEEPHLRKLVIGDAIGSIVMALLNDDKSRKKIDTLDKHLSQFDSEEEVNNREIIDRNNRQEVDQLLQRIEYEEERIGRIQERLPGDFNERRLLQLRTQLEVLQERFRFLQRVLDDTDRA